LIFTIALIVFLALFLKAEPSYVSGSDSKNSSFVDFLAEIFGNVDTLSSNQCRYDAKDNQSCGLDTTKIIENPEGGYLGIYHSSVSEVLQVRLANSTDLLNWIFIKTLEQNAAQPTISRAPNDAYIVAFEKWNSSGAHLRFHYYSNLSTLLNAYSSPDATFDAPITLGNNYEGTPNVYSITVKAPILNACIGFHYYNGSVDNVALGHLTIPLDDPKNISRWTWNAWRQVEYNQKLREEWNVKGNIGDRDYGQIFGRNFTLQEGNLEPNPTNYSEYRIFLYDHLTKSFTKLNITTLQGSTSFGNPTFTFLKSPNGKDAIVVVTYFLFGQGAKTGEAGELIFYKEFSKTPEKVSHEDKTYPLEISSNSTISNFNSSWSQRRIDFDATGPDTTKGYCIVNLTNSLVQDLWQSNYTILIDGKILQFENWKDMESTYIYISYVHPTHEITIIPEFLTQFLTIFMLTTFAIILIKRKGQVVRGRLER
jgi:hypothetical protein